MMDQIEAKKNKPRRKTPADVNDFEREQLRFFLSRENVAQRLAEFNPSLAWLPVLTEMKLVENGAQLTPWIEQNFADAETVQEVVANLHFFDADAAELLEYRLNQKEAELPAYLVKSWRLVIRSMREAKRGLLRTEWFDLAPRIKRGEQSHEVLWRLAQALRPRMAISKRMSWLSNDEEADPQSPSDLISIEYEIDEGITEQEVLGAWPANATAQTEDRLLKLLGRQLNEALEDATDAGVEGDIGYGTSDGDVPSVAKHDQNAYRKGFLTIVRVTAEIWSRLAAKDATLALAFFEEWMASNYRLVRRLGLFAATDRAVPADYAAKALLTLPQGELFLTNSSVEVYRLIRARWGEFNNDEKASIEARIVQGPPVEWYSGSAEAQRYLDRSRFELLGDMRRRQLDLSDTAISALKSIEERYPQWELRNAEQAGFHSWTGTGRRIVTDTVNLETLPDEEVIAQAIKANEKRDFMDGEVWPQFARAFPLRALKALELDAKAGHWRDWAWQPLLWTSKGLDTAADVEKIASLLLDFPGDEFAKVAPSASWWLNEKFAELDETLLWPLWDRLADVAQKEAVQPEADNA